MAEPPGMPLLRGIGVLVTRPEQQAMPLCRLLEAQGANALRFPALEIKPLGERRALASRLGALQAFDLIIFTSANAVRFGVSLLDEKRDLALAAIGPATARALNQAGYRVAVSPRETHDSEGLLLHPRLEHLPGHRILIIKGSDGRQLLQQELTRRGAQVVTADVYQRVSLTPSAATLAAMLERFAANEVQVITATSLSVGNALLDMATPQLRDEFERAQWLVPGERIASSLRERGLRAPLLRSASADDQDVVEALIRWRSSASGA
jgi:uroporphyrinogen-III synthase